MRGQILGVDVRTGEGLLTGEDGVRYRFTPTDWADRGEPAKGLQVDFEPQENRALSIYPVPGATPPALATPVTPTRPANDRNKLVAALLAFFIGIFGVHRFYLGRTGSGIAMLVLTCTIVGMLISGPWAFIDMIRYLIMSDEEFEVRYRRR
ncbi:MAG: hypothetical protein JWN21_2694 [Sphingomonas bacterium]|uniref:TM2 domain-containing protein n=1 Tax=Sphingomonas bacterium TaxID=1895847 RepID=UPI00261F406C|nr:TM2 domain-containing protein [Sphingomonas bacterium]MDB5697151.1 hypothetical protein [Sphingomonas bacterium]